MNNQNIAQASVVQHIVMTPDMSQCLIQGIENIQAPNIADYVSDINY